MIAGEGEADGVDEVDVAVAADRLYVDPPDAEDRDLRWIQQRGEGLDPEAAEIADGERRAGEVVRSDVPFDGLRGEVLHTVGELVDAELVGVADDRNEQAAWGVGGEAQVDVLV